MYYIDSCLGTLFFFFSLSLIDFAKGKISDVEQLVTFLSSYISHWFVVIQMPLIFVCTVLLPHFFLLLFFFFFFFKLLPYFLSHGLICISWSTLLHLIACLFLFFNVESTVWNSCTYVSWNIVYCLSLIDCFTLNVVMKVSS